MKTNPVIPVQPAALLAGVLFCLCPNGGAQPAAFQGPAGANYEGVETNFPELLAVPPAAVAVIESPLAGPLAGIEPAHHLGVRLFGQWNFASSVPVVTSNCPGGNPHAPPPALASGASSHATLVADLLAGAQDGLFRGVVTGATVVAGHILFAPQPAD
jgi:hypothetical protein